MPKVYKQKARKDIYRVGVKTPANNKQGFKRDRSQPKDENDTLLVPKGTEYYVWYFANSQERISLTPPTKRQLTQNEHQLWVYDQEDAIEALNECQDAESFASQLEEIKSEIESRRDELQGRLDNMPEGLQEGSSAGQTLSERIDLLDEAYNELDSIDTDYDEPDDEEILDALGYDEDDEDSEKPDESEIEAKRQELLDEWIQEKAGEAQVTLS